MITTYWAILRWIFLDVGLLWCGVEVLITSVVICLMVRNVETWSDKFKEKHRVPLPLVLVISFVSIAICCAIDYLWNLWSIYDTAGGTLDQLSGFARDLFADKMYVYMILASIILLLCGIYFVCLKPYRVSGLVLIALALCVFALCIFFAQQDFALELKKRILSMRGRVKYSQPMGNRLWHGPRILY